MTILLLSTITFMKVQKLKLIFNLINKIKWVLGREISFAFPLSHWPAHQIWDSEPLPLIEPLTETAQTNKTKPQHKLQSNRPNSHIPHVNAPPVTAVQRLSRNPNPNPNPNPIQQSNRSTPFHRRRWTQSPELLPPNRQIRKPHQEFSTHSRFSDLGPHPDRYRTQIHPLPHRR